MAAEMFDLSDVLATDELIQKLAVRIVQARPFDDAPFNGHHTALLERAIGLPIGGVA